MTVYKLKNGMEVVLQDGEYLYDTCQTCPVFNRCKRVSGESALPNDYVHNNACNGFIMLQRALDLSGLPREYRGLKAADFDMREHSESAQSFLGAMFHRSTDMVSNGSNVALMSLHKGTGKTFAGTIILNEYIYANCMTTFDYENPLAMYVKYGQWANELRTQYQVEDEEYILRVQKKLEAMKNVPLLMLDDIGSGRITKFIRDLTYDVIDYRKENGLSTIFTTNLTEAQLSHVENLGDIVTSRMFFNTMVYEMNGRDRRRDTTMYIQ